MIVYMKCSTYNEAATVLNAFILGVEKYGLPSRVRCDYGGENTLVTRHMVQHRGLHRNSVITGCSIHNQRIERLWRDLHSCVTSFYYRLFYFLEAHGRLEHTYHAFLYALEYVYLPRINHSIQHFVEGWNNHGIRTEHHHSPRQLFSSGVLRLQHSGLVALDFMQTVDTMYGVDSSDSPPINNPNDLINVPSIELYHQTQILH